VGSVETQGTYNCGALKIMSGLLLAALRPKQDHIGEQHVLYTMQSKAAKSSSDLPSEDTSYNEEITLSFF